MEGSQLPVEQVLLYTLVVKIAVMAVLATMLARYRRFRHILIFERRAWPDRLTFALSLGIPLAAGVVARLLLNYNAADLTLEGSFLAGLIAGPYAGATVGAIVGIGPLGNREFIALPFAVGCGFAGGGLRELCPKEAIWHFSPFVFTSLPRRELVGSTLGVSGLAPLAGNLALSLSIHRGETSRLRAESEGLGRTRMVNSRVAVRPEQGNSP